MIEVACASDSRMMMLLETQYGGGIWRYEQASLHIPNSDVSTEC
jgi:hypothetical protein